MPEVHRINELAQLCQEHNVCVLAVGGADGAHDASSKLLLRLVFGDQPDLQRDGILLVTAAAVHVHCSDAAWAMSGLLASCATPAHVYCAPGSAPPGSDEAIAFKLATAQRMISRFVAAPLITGTQPLRSWPLLRVVGADASIKAGSAAAGMAVQQLLFSCGGGACELASGRIARRWEEMLRGADRFAEDDNVDALNEAALEPLLCRDGGDGSCVRVGTRTAALLTDEETKPSRRAARSTGRDRRNALHLVAVAGDGAVPGLRAARSCFLSNGVVPHHWQHRVFPDGEAPAASLELALSQKLAPAACQAGPRRLGG